MAKKIVNKNILPLLAITALVLSVSLVDYSNFKFLGNQSTQSVLSESDENKLDEVEDEKDTEDQDKSVQTKRETTSQSREVTRAKEKKDQDEDSKSGSDNIQIEEEVEIEDSSDADEDKVDDEIETEFEQESETTSASGTVNKFKLKIKTKTVAGKTIIETASGEVEVEKDPDDAINELVDSGLIDDPTSFEAKTNNREKVEFEIQGTDSKKFLGIFNVVIPKLITVSSETGEVLSTNQNVWSRILSLLSI